MGWLFPIDSVKIQGANLEAFLHQNSVVPKLCESDLQEDKLARTDEFLYWRTAAGPGGRVAD